MKKPILIGYIIILAFLVTASCGNSPVDPVISDGAWTGSVLGQSITFNVSGNHVRDLNVTFIYWGLSLPQDSILWTPDNASISNNYFHMSDTLTSGYYSYTMTIDGTFNPPTDISGMFSTTGAFDSAGVHHYSSDSLSWSGSHQ